LHTAGHRGEIHLPQGNPAGCHEFLAEGAPAGDSYPGIAQGRHQQLLMALGEIGPALLGINAVDYSGYPDCRPEYLAAFAHLATLATKAGVEGRPCELLAPLVHLPKEAIIRLGLGLGLDYGLTTSCYDPGPGGRPCGGCDSCLLRAAGFAAAGAADPRVDPARWV